MTRRLTFEARLRFRGFALEASDAIPLDGITALSGPSGSGKTTLLRVLAGLERRAEARIDFAGVDWSALATAARGIGYVFQDSRLFPHLSVAGNLEYGARRRGIGADGVGAVIDALDLAPLLDRAPATLSGGETRRVALGRALAGGPRILFMDEPLTGLDRARKADLLPYIARAVVGFGVPALYVTHAAGEIEFLADRILTMAGGRLTGWQPAPARLTGKVVETVPGAVWLEIAGSRLRIPGQGRAGEVWAVPVGREAILSLADPGPSSAALAIRGTATGPIGADGQVPLAFGEQRVTLPAAEIEPAPGKPVWLSLRQAVGRPL